MNRLKELRERKGMKQSELGKLLNVQEATISKYESGKIPMTADTIIKCSEIFMTPTDVILGLKKAIPEDATGSAEFLLKAIEHVSERKNDNSIPHGIDGSIIRQIRKKNKLTQEALGQKLGVVKQTVSNWENNISEPDSELLSNMASIFDVPVGYFYNNEDYSVSSFSRWPECRQRILDMLKVLSISKTYFEEEIGFSLNNGISVDDLIKIAEYLNVTTDYLLGLTDTGSAASSGSDLTDRERNILAAFRKLDDDDKDIIVGEIKKCLKEQRHSSVAADEPPKKTGTSNTGN